MSGNDADTAAVRLDLEQLKELQQGNDWKRLVLPKGHREMVQAMVETHSKGSREPSWDGSNSQGKVAMDLVQGKGAVPGSLPRCAGTDVQTGRGCIILLHGVPGVGKTSTAGKSSHSDEGIGLADSRRMRCFVYGKAPVPDNMR